MKKIISISIVVATASFLSLFFWIKQDATLVPTSNEEIKTEPSKLIIAFGDSLTAGYRLPLFESYPAQLEQKLKDEGYSVTVINAGVSGETTRGNLERAQFIRDQNPDMVILGIGGNDALRFLPIEETRKNLNSIVEVLLSGENPPKVLLLKMQAPLNGGPEYKRIFDSLYEETADVYKLKTIPFIVAEVFLNAQYMLDDRIHPNKEGYGLLVEKYLLKEVIRNLK